MNDKTKTFAINSLECRKIKGHTRIELTKVATGEKKVIEHDNTFQSSLLTAFLRSFGVANNNPFANSTFAGRPLWRNLCGGILLFRDEIQAPASYMPAGNLMVANGAYGVTNNGTPSELGSYNSIESSTNGASSLSFVYDWGTSQGNGTISCVCLTSETGGFIGYGNASGNSATLRNIFENQESTRKDAHLYYDGKHYRVISVDYTAKKEIAIFKSSTADQIDNGTAANILVLNVSTRTARLQPIVNTSGKKLQVVYIRGLRLMRDSNNHYYLPTVDGNNMEEFDSDGVFIAEHSAAGGSTVLGGPIAPGLVGFANDNNSRIVLYDGTSDRPTNGKFPDELPMYNSNYDAFFAGAAGDITMSVAVRPYKNPLYLATINNLDNTVTKDSTQTMKVIYTLTEAS